MSTPCLEADSSPGRAESCFAKVMSCEAEKCKAAAAATSWQQTYVRLVSCVDDRQLWSIIYGSGEDCSPGMSQGNDQVTSVFAGGISE